VDTRVLIVGGIAVFASLVALLALISQRRLARAVDHAIERIGGSPAIRWWRRPAALRREIQILEERVTESHRDRALQGAAIATAPIGILLTNDNGEILFINEAASQFVGLRGNEPVPDSRLRQAIESAVLSRRSVSREIDLSTPKPLQLQVDVLPLEHGVESVGAVTYIRDLTVQREVETLRSDFVTNVGRELKAPLGALTALAGTLADKTTDPAVTAGLADRLGREAGRLSGMIDDMLDLSHAEAAGRPRAVVRIDALLGGIATELAPLADQRGVDLHVDRASDALMVWGERRQLHTLLAAIVENAIEYSVEGPGNRRPLVSVHAGRAGGEVFVSVEDEGIGISGRHLTRIFERFYRVDPDRQGAGSGLGLAIARHIARNHDGDVGVESQIGAGSTFRIRLPAWKA